LHWRRRALSIPNLSLRTNLRTKPELEAPLVPVAPLARSPLTLQRTAPKTPAFGTQGTCFLRWSRPEPTRGRTVQPKPPSTGRVTPCPSAAMLRPRVATPGTPGAPEIDLEPRLDSLVEDVKGKVGEDPVGHAKTPREVARDVERHKRIRLEVVSVEAIKVLAGET
jgi:hypothetical protein